MLLMPTIPSVALMLHARPERVVQCIEFQGELIVATETRVFKLVGDTLVLIPFSTEKKDAE